MLVVLKKDTSVSMKTPDQPMLGFWDSKKVGGTSNEIFPLVIIAMNVQFDVYRVLIESGNWGDIMYSELFKKKCLKKRKLMVLQRIGPTCIHQHKNKFV